MVLLFILRNPRLLNLSAHNVRKEEEEEEDEDLGLADEICLCVCVRVCVCVWMDGSREE